MRLFVGLDIPKEIRERLAKFTEGLQGFAPDVRFVNPETFHITLKFLGETEKVQEIKQALAGIACPGFEVAFRGTGFFPGERNPRVFWVGIEAPPELQKLAGAVDAAMSPLGFESESGEYHPHLTLARSGSGRPRPGPKDKPNQKFAMIQRRLASLPSPEFGTMQAKEFFLYESKLSPRGAQYFKVARYALSQG